jgi:hypothetical protein
MKTLSCFIFLAVCTCIAAAQWTPVTAGIRETNEVVKEGVVTKTAVREGLFLRTSDGSTLTRWDSGNGNLLNNTTHRSYSLDYKNMQAKQGAFEMEPLEKDQFARMPTVGNGTVSGIACRKVPILLQNIQKGSSERIGEACVSDTQGFVLKEETRVTRDDGSVVHNVIEKFDIKLNVKPSAAEFDMKRFAYAEVPAQKAPAMK